MTTFGCMLNVCSPVVHRRDQEFKAKCLALLDEIDEHGGTITVTKRGRPVATVSAAKKKPEWRSPKNLLCRPGSKIVRRYRQRSPLHICEALRRDEEAE